MKTKSPWEVNLPDYVKTVGEYETFYRKYEGGTKRIKNGISFVIISMLIIMIGIVLSKISIVPNLLGIVQSYFIFPIIILLIGMLIGLALMFLKATIHNHKLYRCYKKEIRPRWISGVLSFK